MSLGDVEGAEGADALPLVFTLAPDSETNAEPLMSVLLPLPNFIAEPATISKLAPASMLISFATIFISPAGDCRQTSPLRASMTNSSPTVRIQGNAARAAAILDDELAIFIVKNDA